jgi:hypothetical protein
MKPTNYSVFEYIYDHFGIQRGEKLPSFTSVDGCIIYGTSNDEIICSNCASEWMDEKNPIVMTIPFNEGPVKHCNNCSCAIESGYCEYLFLPDAFPKENMKKSIKPKAYIVRLNYGYDGDRLTVFLNKEKAEKYLASCMKEKDRLQDQYDTIMKLVAVRRGEGAQPLELNAYKNNLLTDCGFHADAAKLLSLEKEDYYNHFGSPYGGIFFSLEEAELGE